MAFVAPQKVQIRNIAEVHQALSSYLAQHQDIEIDLTNCEECDLAFLQLILSARKTATDAGKPVRLSAPASGAVLAVLERSGVAQTLSADDAKFWLQREVN